MPKMALLAIAGSSALAGAALTYVLARPRAVMAGMAASMPSAAGETPPGESQSEWGDRFRTWRSWCMEHRGHGRGRGPGSCGPRRSSRLDQTGNAAFDEYRQQALDRLETEAKEFRDFLDRLRHARDKSEFDAFMGQRKTGDQPPPAA